MEDAPKELDLTTRRKLAAEASVDLRTLDRAIKGLPIRGIAGDRARRALRAAGFIVATPKDGAA